MTTIELDKLNDDQRKSSQDGSSEDIAVSYLQISERISFVLRTISLLIMSVSIVQRADQIIGFLYSEELVFNKINMLDYDTKLESTDTVNDNTTNKVTLKKMAINFLLDI